MQFFVSSMYFFYSFDFRPSTFDHSIIMRVCVKAIAMGVSYVNKHFVKKSNSQKVIIFKSEVIYLITKVRKYNKRLQEE